MSTSPQQSVLAQLRSQLSQFSTSHTQIQQKLVHLTQTRGKINNQILGLTKDYEKRIKQLQHKLDDLTSKNQVLNKQNIMYKRDIEGFEGRLVQKQKLIAMLISQQSHHQSVNWETTGASRNKFQLDKTGERKEKASKKQYEKVLPKSIQEHQQKTNDQAKGLQNSNTNKGQFETQENQSGHLGKIKNNEIKSKHRHQTEQRKYSHAQVQDNGKKPQIQKQNNQNINEDGHNDEIENHVQRQLKTQQKSKASKKNVLPPPPPKGTNRVPPPVKKKSQQIKYQVQQVQQLDIEKNQKLLAKTHSETYKQAQNQNFEENLRTSDHKQHEIQQSKQTNISYAPPPPPPKKPTTKAKKLPPPKKTITNVESKPFQNQNQVENEQSGGLENHFHQSPAQHNQQYNYPKQSHIAQQNTPQFTQQQTKPSEHTQQYNNQLNQNSSNSHPFDHEEYNPFNSNDDIQQEQVPQPKKTNKSKKRTVPKRIQQVNFYQENSPSQEDANQGQGIYHQSHQQRHNEYETNPSAEDFFGNLGSEGPSSQQNINRKHRNQIGGSGSPMIQAQQSSIDYADSHSVLSSTAGHMLDSQYIPQQNTAPTTAATQIKKMTKKKQKRQVKQLEDGSFV